MREVWRREQTWAPYFVGEEITDARLAAAAFRQDVVLWRAEAQLHGVGSPQRERIEIDIAAAEQAATSGDARAQHLQAIHGARADWTRESGPARIRHEKAGEELERRGLARVIAPVVVEQPALFEAIDPDPTTSARERDVNQESLDLDLDSASRDETMDPITVTREPQQRNQVRDQQEHTLASDQVVDEAQEALFAAIPRAEDHAAAQPLRAGPAAGPGLADGLGPITVGEARRQAEISTAARSERGVTSRDVREWELDLDETEAAANAARSGRDHNDDLAHTLGHTLTRGAGRNTGPELSTGFGRGMSR
jgi:hypothetical protein